VQGEGVVGALGYGNTNSRTTASSSVINFGSKTPSVIDAGQRHMMALMTDGTIMVWGDDQESQLGVTNYVGATSPVNGHTFNELVVAISAHMDVSCVTLASGCMKCWCV
jgi:alpha-tubulin suppressor-like RCC1 family protein